MYKISILSIYGRNTLSVSKREFPVSNKIEHLTDPKGDDFHSPLYKMFTSHLHITHPCTFQGDDGWDVCFSVRSVIVLSSWWVQKRNYSYNNVFIIPPPFIIEDDKRYILFHFSLIVEEFTLLLSDSPVL